MDRRGSFTEEEEDPWPGRPAINYRQPQGEHVSPYGPVQQTVNPSQLYHAPLSNAHFDEPLQQYYSSQLPFDNHLFQQSQNSYADIEFQPQLQPQLPLGTSEYQNPLNRGFVTNGPIVHEGFIPAPGHEEDDDLEGYFRDSLLQNQDDDDDDDDSEDEEAIRAEEERFLQALDEKNDDAEHDSDYSIHDAEEIEDDPDELADEDVDDEEDPRSSIRGGRGRGVGRGRGRGRGRGGSRGTRGRKSGQPGRPKGTRARPIADPGPQFKEFQRIANDAYLRKDYPNAIEFANKAIQLNPEIFAAHSLLSEIYNAMGNEQKSLEALLFGAPTRRDKDLWYYIIDRVKKIDPKEYPVFTNSNKTGVILDCLRSIILIDPHDYDARSQKLEIDASLGHFSKSVKMCLKMLKLQPDDIAVLKTMARLGTSSAKQTRLHVKKIIESFDASINHFMEHEEPSTSNLDWSLLNIYLDLLERSGDHVRGLSRAKSISRWIQMRKGETYWDDQPDDREFDIEDGPRRTTVPEFFRVSINTKYGKTLPLEIRVKMGLFRLRLKPPDLEEAMHHFEMLEPEDDDPHPMVQDYPDLYRDVADALHISGFNLEAIRFYEPLYDMAPEHMVLRDYIGMYSSYLATEQVEKAEQLLPIFQKWNPDALEDMAVLAKFFEDHGFSDDAMKRGEAVYKFGGGRLLQKIGFQGYADLQEYFHMEKKRARGKHGVRKARVKKYVKALRAATGDQDDSEDEGGREMPSLGPVTYRPKPGLFRTRKLLPNHRPKTFLPDEIPGTNVPMDAFDHELFKRKLNELATNFPEELKAARAQHRDIVASFRQLEQLSDAAEEGDEEATSEWISIARELVEEFSTFDLFYFDRTKPFQGYFRRIGAHNELWKESALMVLAVVANNVEDGEPEPEVQEKPEKAPEDFYGIHFDKWFNVFAQYAVLLARHGDEARCFNTIEVANQSNVFHRSQHYSHQLAMCRLICGIALDDSIQSSSALRWFMRTYPFGSDLFRLFGGVNRVCSVPAGFATGATLKVFMRYIKIMDYALLKLDQREWFNFRGNDRIDWMAQIGSGEATKYVKDHDPAVFAIYAHVLMCGGSCTAALNYYFRAFAITPRDPVLNLSIGVAYIQHAMKRLSENRQFQIQQGLAFVYRYHELRTEENIAVYCSEAEFNLGRIWHTLGLVSQAIPAYERCIQLSKRVKEEAEQSSRGHDGVKDDFATEAAFAIQTIYMLSGNFEGARKVTEEVLVIE